MTHPAAPESPEAEQCSICLARPPYGACAGDESCAYIMKLERHVAQAQARYAELEKALRGVLAEADRDTDAFIFARRILKDRP